MIAYLLLGAALFYVFSRLAVSSLLSIILLVLMIVSFIWVTQTRQTSSPPSVLQGDIEDKKEIVATNYVVKRANKKLLYLHRNPELKNIALNLRFTRIFDKARFSELLIHMDKLQKVYMYILAGRYKPQQYIPIFKDLRASISEILYSFFMVVPQGLKHTYGIQPYKELEDGISKFNVATRTMIKVLHNHAKSNGFTVVEDHVHPYEKDRKNILP